MRGKKRGFRRKKNQLLKRAISILAILVLCITGMDLSALGQVFAEETSGYKLEVEYSQDYSSAVIKGDSSGVGQNIQLAELSDESGQTYAVEEFQYSVEENGEYNFNLTYYENVDGNLTEKEESLKVEVNDIVKIESEDNSSSAQVTSETEVVCQETEEEQEEAADTVLEGEVQDNEVQEENGGETVAEQSLENQQEEDEDQESDSDFPDTLPIETLKANAEQLMAGRSSVSALSNETGGLTKTVTAVAEENQIKLNFEDGSSEFQFSAGVFSVDTVPAVNEQREFYRALYVDGNGAQYEINGIYPYSNDTGIEWYYTLKTVQQNGTASGNGTDSAGDISLGFLMDSENGQIWAEYALDESAPSYTINISGTGVVNISRDNTGFWKVNAPETAKHTEKVVFEFDVPAAYQDARVNILDSTGNTIKSFTTESGDSLTIVDEARRRYSGIFDMPSGGATIQFTAVEYTTGQTRYYGFGVDGGDIASLSTGSGLSSVSADITWKRTNSSTTKDATLDWEGLYYSGKIVGQSAPTYTNGNITVSEEAKNKPYYNLDGSSTSLPVAWGEFNISDDVVLEVSYGMYQRQYASGSYQSVWRKVPTSLRIDTYPNTVNNDEVVSEVIELPTATGADNAVTQTLSCGASVTIECTKRFGSGSFSTSYSGYTGFLSDDQSYFTYIITVSNMPYAFKTYLNADSSAQKTILFNIDEESIIVGSGACANASTSTSPGDMAEFVTSQGGLQGSFWSGGNKSADYETGKRYAYSLTDSLGIWGKYSISSDLNSRNTGYFELYIKVKEGYGQPTVTASSGSVNFVGVKSGYFFFTYQTGSADPIYIDISAEPITFDFLYRDGEGNTIGADAGYVPATASQYVLKTVALDSPKTVNGEQKYFQGWRIEYHVDYETTNQVVDPTIYYSGQTVSLKDIYSSMLENGWIDTNTKYDVYIVAQWGDRNENSLIPATYKISYQNVAEGLTITAAGKPTDISGLEERYGEYIETKAEATVNAYYNQTARLAGYESQFQVEGENTKYLLSPDSIVTGKITEDNQLFAHLIYMYAVSVEFDTDASKYGTGGSFDSVESIQAINEKLADTYYIPAENYNLNGRKAWALELFADGDGKTDPLSTYNPGTNGNRAFVGWKVQTSTGKTWIIDGESRKWLNIYNLATQEPDLWAEAVEAGKIVLEPVWEDDIGKITAQGSEDLVQTTPESHSVTTSTEYSISNTFSYTGKWDAAGFSYALRKDNGDGTYDVWYSYVDGAEGTKKTGVTAEVSNDDEAKTVTVTITIPAELVSKANLQDQTLSLSAWNSANGVTNKEMATSALGMAAKVNNVFTTSPQAITLVSQKTQSIETPERKGYQITAQFTYDPLYYSMDDLKDTVEGLSYAVYYQTKDGNVIKKWTKEDGGIAVIDNSTGPALTYYAPDRINGLLTLKFWVGSAADQTGDLNSSGVDMQHDNSHYYIACWNTTNGNYSIDDVLNEIKAGTSTSVPCTDITTHVTWRDPDFYVTIPATIMLEDGNGKSDDYAGKKVQISFSSNTSTESSEYKVPSISVAVQGEITLTNDSGESREVLVCRSDGTEISPSSGNYDIGTLAYNNRSIEVWLNTLKGNKRGEKWTGIATFTLTNTSKYPEASTVSENTDVAINTDD